MNEIRSAPVAAVFALHPQDKRGSCRWCGKPTRERTPSQNQLRWWHSECEAEYLCCVRPDQARWQVWQRDKGICFDCGAPPETVTRQRSVNKETQWEHVEDFSVELWHVDHHIPLWKVRHLHPLQRIEYFKLANLITRCERCHARKSAKESAERAHFKRISKKEKPKVKSRWSSRTIESRPFSKQHKPLRGSKRRN